MTPLPGIAVPAAQLSRRTPARRTVTMLTIRLLLSGSGTDDADVPVGLTSGVKGL